MTTVEPVRVTPVPEGRAVATRKPQTSLEVITRTEVESQMTFALANPRSLAKFKADAIEMATLDRTIAKKCFYKLPRGGKDLDGPSIRLAEIIAAAYGNLRCAARVIEIAESYVVAQGVCLDVEKNSVFSTEVRSRITDKNGVRYNDDMIIVTSNAACSKAVRNAIFRVVPLALVEPVSIAAKACAAGNRDTIVEDRANAVSAWASKGVSEKQLCAKFNAAGIEDLGPAELSDLLGYWNALEDKEVTLDEIFPAPVKAAPVEPGKTAAQSAMAAKAAAARGEVKAPAAAQQPATTGPRRSAPPKPNPKDAELLAADEEARQREAAEQREPGQEG